MKLIENATIEKNINIYFEGKVTSRNILLKNGVKKTLGVMMPGIYEFETEKKEIMEIISGKLKVLLPDHAEWQEINEETEFEVPSNSKFKIEILSLTNYCCSYVD